MKIETICIIIGFIIAGALICIKGVKILIDGEPMLGSIVSFLGVCLAIGILLISTV